METALYSSAYFAPVQYYWHWNRSPVRKLEVCEHYLKQTWRNRCVIATANGPMSLSFPVESNSGKKDIRDVRVSNHGNWLRLHWLSLESAYNSSPFYEYYADDLQPYFEKYPVYLIDFNESIREKICELLGLSPDCSFTESYQSAGQLPEEWHDYRSLISPKNGLSDEPGFLPRPYYQVFENKFGFQPNLSILDLLFNMGPESILYL